jgi:transcription initiation factor TFIID subunit TAF12
LLLVGPQQQRLGVDQLQVQLATNISPAATAWLNELYDGTTSSMQHLPDLQAAAAVQQQQQAQAALLQSLRQQQEHLSSSSSSSEGGCCGSNGGSNGHQQLPEVTDALLQHIMDVVRYNAYSDLHDDLAAAAAAGRNPVSLIGLYPEFSFFNHSCVPNCINWVLPGEPRAMVVRAARNIPAGEQATISYLGGPQLLPLSGRQQALGNFGFVCR